MVHLANYLFLFGGFFCILGLVLAVSRHFEKRRRRAAEFRNYFCYHFNHEFLPSNSTRDDDPLAAHRSQFSTLRLRTIDLSTPRATKIGGKVPHNLE
jgi:hypothetical protein